MKKITLLALAISFGLSGCLNQTLKKANKEYETLRYKDAITHYEKYLAKKDNNDARVNLANSYRSVNRYKDAIDTYAKVINTPGIAPINYLHYARLLMSDNQYTEAKKWIKKYLETNKGDIVANMLLASCNSIADRYRDTTLWELRKIDIPSFTATFSAVEYQNGVVFTGEKKVFTGNKENPWTGNSYLELYSMEKDKDGQWMAPRLLKGEINGKFHEGPATFSSTGNVVYFTRSNYYKRKLEANENKESNLKIFKATKVGDEWKKLEELPFNSDDYSCGHPTFGTDDNTLFFVSDMPGGFGGTDIYVTRFNGKEWSKPENLGAPVNTPGNEMFPYMHSDGTLYFSSTAHNSMGGLDVFLTYYANGRWMQPENLNYPLNSSKDDFGFSFTNDNVNGFVTSNRKDKDNVYEFSKKAPTFRLFGTARKKGTQIPVEGVKVVITDDSNKELVFVSDKNGKFETKLEHEKEYFLLCSKFGCFARTDKISTKGKKYSEDFYADFEVEEIIIDKPIVLENIYYDFDKWVIREDAAKELNKLIRILKDNPNISIEMGSHTDCRGKDMYNMVLSNKRAKAAVDYLISQGIDPSRLKWKGYGESKPRNKCVNGVVCSEEEHQWNRRTEFKVTKISPEK